MTGGDPENAAHITGQYQLVESAKLRGQKFKMFFTGLVFATLSFIGTHPIKTTYLLLKISETISQISLLLCGIILLIQLAEYTIHSSKNIHIVKKISLEIIYKKSLGYWLLFITGMTLMVINRSILSFTN
jgi:hypothetical protein